MSSPRRPSNEKIVCEACHNHFPADSPTCPTCKWQVGRHPESNEAALCTLRRIARAVESIRYYMWDDRQERR